MKAELNNSVRIYQQFVDSNVVLKKRENELRQTINELEAKKAELQKPNLNEPLPECHKNNGNKDVSLEVQQEEVISINDVLISQPNVSINYDQSEKEMLHYLSSPLLPLNESSSRTLQVHDIQDDLASVRRRNHEIFDTGDLS